MFAIVRNDIAGPTEGQQSILEIFADRETARLGLLLLADSVGSMPNLSVGGLETDQFHVFLKGRDLGPRSFIRIEGF